MQLNAHDVGLKIGARIAALRAKPVTQDNAPPVPLTPTETVEPQAVAQPAPIVNVETVAPVVNVTTPPAEVVVNVAAPVTPEPVVHIQASPAPIVNVTTPEVTVNVPPPVVNVNVDVMPIADAVRELAQAVKGNRSELELIQVEMRGQADAITSLAEAMTAPRSLVMGKDGKPTGVVIGKRPASLIGK